MKSRSQPGHRVPPEGVRTLSEARSDAAPPVETGAGIGSLMPPPRRAQSVCGGQSVLTVAGPRKSLQRTFNRCNSCGAAILRTRFEPAKCRRSVVAAFRGKLRHGIAAKKTVPPRISRMCARFARAVATNGASADSAAPARIGALLKRAVSGRRATLLSASV